MSIPNNHPRKASLEQRHALEVGLKKGVVTPTGMIAFGRGEAFDYLFEEKTSMHAKKACQAAAALLLLSQKPVISVNGNVAMIAPRQTIELANATGALIEANIFYPPQKRRALIAKEFLKHGKKILGVSPTERLQGLTSERSLVDKKGIFLADTVVVPLEDGDRTQALKNAGKQVIAIDLNPKSRTAIAADITIVDNVMRAFPLITQFAQKLKNLPRQKLEKIAESFDNKKNLKASLKLMKKKL